MRRMVTVVFAGLLSGGSVQAQDIGTRIDEIFRSIPPAAPGCVVGVSQQGRVLTNRAYGMSDLERGIALTPESVFDIGSVTKHFVAAAVLLLVEDGRIALSDDIRKYVPELPDYGHTITIDHLLTHTSGLRDWVWLSQLAGGRDDVLTVILRQRGLNFAPGEAWAYSNSNYELARELVRRVSGQSLPDFMRTRLFEPLGMHATRYAADVSTVPNHAIAYEQRGGQWTQDMLLGKGRGGGAVFSTAGDLLVWNDALTSGRLGAFVTAKLQEPATLSNGRRLGYARGLMLDGQGADQIVWHSGDAAAFNAVVARLPARSVSLSLLCNGGEVTDREDYEARIMELFLTPATDPPAPAVAGVPIAPAELNGRAGLFFDDVTGDALRLIVNGDRLRVAGGPALVAVSADRFRNPRGSTRFFSNDEFELHFTSPDRLELKSMEGKVTRYSRARPFAPDSAQLAAYGGRYQTEDIGALEITPTGNGLTGRINDSPVLEFTPVHPDVFQRGMMTIRFRRDAAGRVTGLELTNPALRNAHFPRRGESSLAPPPAPAPAPAATALAMYEGTYTLQAPDRTVELRVWVDAQGRLNGEVVGAGQPMVFRPATAHRFLHPTRDELWVQFTVEGGRATGATLHNPNREISGPRRQGGS